jgi:hypothetical protein
VLRLLESRLALGCPASGLADVGWVIARSAPYRVSAQAYFTNYIVNQLFQFAHCAIQFLETVLAGLIGLKVTGDVDVQECFMDPQSKKACFGRGPQRRSAQLTQLD